MAVCQIIMYYHFSSNLLFIKSHTKLRDPQITQENNNLNITDIITLTVNHN